MIVIRVFHEVSGEEICHDTIYSGCMSEAKSEAKRYNRMRNITAEIEVTDMLQKCNVI